MRTRYGHDEHLVTGAIEVYIGVAMRESVRCFDSREMVQHGLLHSELYVMAVSVVRWGCVTYEPCKDLCLGLIWVKRYLQHLFECP